MRTISASALTQLTEKKGGEPINVVEIQWTDTASIYYADRSFIDYGIQGKILNMSSLENIINITQSGNSQSVSITLDDVDGSIKGIYNYNDIHKRPIRIYQWFSGIHFDDRFLIFQGELSSPIVWKEGDRTLSFEVLSKLEDKEVGFSAEEGQFNIIPDELIGKAWPLPFGTCLQIPAITLDPIPAGVTLQANGVDDPAIDDQIAELIRKGIELQGLIQTLLLAAGSAYNESHYDENGSYQSGRQDEQLEQLGDSLIQQAEQYMAEANKISQEMANLVQVKSKQQTFKKNSIPVSNGECFPQNTSLSARINGVKHQGKMNGQNFIIDEVTHPAKEGEEQQISTVPISGSIVQGGQDVITPLGFTWIPAGKVFKLETDLPVRFIVAMIPVTVLNVWAYRNYNDARILTRVPAEYYTVGTTSFGSIIATIVTLTKPLSHREDGWDDDLFMDVQSDIGPNTVDIIQWLIQNYTILGIDATSFNAVRERITPFPSNFCLFRRVNIVQLLSEIAYQARCAIWLNNGVFYIRYLPDEPAPVDEITEADISVNSLEIHHTTTEDIVTKLVALYRTNYGDDKEYKIILRNNVVKYGTQEQEQDWYIYNHPNLVDLAATFWMIRQSNTWKILRFRTPLHKLRLETFDAITINLGSNHASITPIVGIINQVQFNSESWELDFEVWIPVRAGEMTKYSFAWPVDSSVLVYPDVTTLVGSGGPGEEADGSLEPANGTCVPKIRYNRVKEPKRRRHHDGNPNPGGTVDGSVVINPLVTGIEQSQQPLFNYNFRTHNFAQPVVQAQSTTVPGKIFSGDGPTYKVDLYMKGLNNPPSRSIAKDVDHKEKLDKDTWIMCMILVYTKEENGQKVTKMEKLFVVAAAKPGVFPGRIKSGTGSTYTVDVFKQGLGQNATEVSGVTQLQIDNSDTIPAGTWCMVGESKKNDGSPDFFIQVPVWVE